ncbi:MAG: hemerythrin domain-containing protein [Planctomycetes bacterium]|nr:hemerythrin domain-containing protein [Planctomycetota bacterium]
MNLQEDPPAAPENRACGGCGCAGAGLHPVDVLSAEHQTILAVLAAMAAEQRALFDGGPVREPFWQAALEFLAGYADRCHHGKEEQLLFAELEQAGMSRERGPTACMRAEHDMGRQARQAMVEALQDHDAPRLAEAAGGYVALLRDHIDKEDHVLFPLARSMLDAAAVARLQAGFARVEHDDLGEGVHGRYEQLARDLAGGLPPAPPR